MHRRPQRRLARQAALQRAVPLRVLLGPVRGARRCLRRRRAPRARPRAGRLGRGCGLPGGLAARLRLLPQAQRCVERVVGVQQRGQRVVGDLLCHACLRGRRSAGFNPQTRILVQKDSMQLQP